MNRIKVRYKTNAVLGEILIICCTIFCVLTQDDFEFFPVGEESRTSNTAITILTKDVFETHRIAANETKQFYILSQSEEKEFFLILLSANSKSHWTLHFRNANNTGRLDNEERPESFLYAGPVVNEEIFSRDAELGLYSLKVFATDDDWFAVYYCLDSTGVELQKMVQIADNRSNPRQMKVMFDLKNNSSTIEWPGIENNYDLIGKGMSIVIGTKKYYQFLTEAEHDHNELNEEAEDEPKDYFLLKNVTSSTKVVIGDLSHGQIYYVTLLVDNESFCVVYARTSFMYKKTKPVGLKDGKLMRDSLRRNGGRLFYKHKVSLKRFQNFSGPLMWYVKRCSGMIWVEIKHKKKILQKKLVKTYEFFRIDQLVPNDRYIMKITDASTHQNLEFDHVEVLVTIRPRLNPTIQVPENLQVLDLNEKTKRVKSLYPFINWKLIASDKPIIYCTYSKEIKQMTYGGHELIENMATANQCNFKTLENSYRRHFCEAVNYTVSGSGTIKRRLRQLNRNHDNVVQITAKKPQSEIIVFYNLLKIPRIDFH